MHSFRPAQQNCPKHSCASFHSHSAESSPAASQSATELLLPSSSKQQLLSWYNIPTWTSQYSWARANPSEVASTPQKSWTFSGLPGSARHCSLHVLSWYSSSLYVKPLYVKIWVLSATPAVTVSQQSTLTTTEGYIIFPKCPLNNYMLFESLQVCRVSSKGYWSKWARSPRKTVSTNKGK